MMNQQYFEEWERQGCQEYTNGSAKFKLTPKKALKLTEKNTTQSQYIGNITWKLKKRRINNGTTNT